MKYITSFKRSALRAVAALFALAMLAPPSGVLAQGLTVRVSKSDGTAAEVVGMASLQESVGAIPLETVVGLKVSAGTFAEGDWEWLKSNRGGLNALVEFTITAEVDQVADIPKGAIFGPQIREVRAAKLVRIGEVAFASCKALTTVDFPQVTHVGEDAFYDCTSLHSVSFPQAVSVGDRAFWDCSALTRGDFPLVESVGGGAHSRIALGSLR